MAQGITEVIELAQDVAVSSSSGSCSLTLAVVQDMAAGLELTRYVPELGPVHGRRPRARARAPGPERSESADVVELAGGAAQSPPWASSVASRVYSSTVAKVLR